MPHCRRLLEMVAAAVAKLPPWRHSKESMATSRVLYVHQHFCLLSKLFDDATQQEKGNGQGIVAKYSMFKQDYQIHLYKIHFCI